MATCTKCGGVVEFRHIDGVVTPLHEGGGCSGASDREVILNYERQDDYCRKTYCRECGEPVFFIRHNGGSLFVDELGWPWPKHPCYESENRMIVIDALLGLKSPRGAIVTQVRFTERLRFVDDACEMVISSLERLFPPQRWYVEEVADPRALLGELVVISPDDGTLVHLGGETYKIAKPEGVSRCVVCERRVILSELDDHLNEQHCLKRCSECQELFREVQMTPHVAFSHPRQSGRLNRRRR